VKTTVNMGRKKVLSGTAPSRSRLCLCMLLSPCLSFAQQNGSAWTNVGPSPAAVEAILVDPQGSGTIFIGSEGGGVRKSVDGGITWSADNSGLTNPIVLELAMDASGPQTVYAGTSGGGLFKTGDGGAININSTSFGRVTGSAPFSNAGVGTSSPTRM
jgi:hypothetical protein